MTDIKLEFNQTQMATLQKELRGWPAGIRKAMYQSINDTTTKLRGQMASDLSKSITMKRRDIVPLISRTKAKAAKLQANVEMKEAARVSLARFSAKQTKKGITYKIKKSGPRSLIKSAFGLSIDKLNRQVFRRVGKSRLPIVRLFGPSPAVAFLGEKLDVKTEFDADALLDKNLNRRIKFLLLKRSGAI